jgi:metal-dependent amidase/aminoacylase/carboxypeptidase family protein
MMAGRDRAVATVRGPRAAEVARALAEELRDISTLAPDKLFEPAALDNVAIEALAQLGSDQAWRVLVMVTAGSRAARADVRVALESLIHEIESPGAALELDYRERFLPGVENDPTLVRRASARLREIFGPDGVRPLTGVVPAFSEDFGFFQDLAPGVMFFLGVSNTKNATTGMPHTPDYVADEEALFVGARGMAAVLCDALEPR